jgi:hypothetical protein
MAKTRKSKKTSNIFGRGVKRLGKGEKWALGLSAAGVLSNIPTLFLPGFRAISALAMIGGTGTLAGYVAARGAGKNKPKYQWSKRQTQLAKQGKNVRGWFAATQWPVSIPFQAHGYKKYK